MKIGVVGLWHLGEVVSSCLPALGHSVVGYDPDPKVIEEFRRGETALEEPKIRELIAAHTRNGKLSYAVFKPAIAKLHDVFVVTFDTPIAKDDRPDTALIEKTVLTLARDGKQELLIIIMSQMPVGLTKNLQAKVMKLKKNVRLAYVPENLQLGKAVESFMKPKRTIIGVDSEEVAVKVRDIYMGLPGEFIVMSPSSAEMVKHALNSFLATSLSFIYNISDLCEAVGADVVAVTRALKSDPRIGEAAYLDTSLGFSGGTLMRDMRVLETFAQNAKIEIPVISGSIKTNIGRLTRVLILLKKGLGESLKDKNVTVLGLTYKPGTPSLRSSLAISLMKLLKKNGLKVTGSDPMASLNEIKKETGSEARADPYEAARNAKAIIMITAWPEYATLDLVKLKKVMLAPYLFVDARNFLASRAREFQELGFRYQGIGRGSIDL